jgi:hypothetical protein
MIVNWEAIGAIAEAMGAAGVIVSLAYLAIQIRSNTRAVKVAAYQQTHTGGRDINLAILTNPDLLMMLARRSGLSTDQEQFDKRRETMFFLIYLFNWESQSYQYDQGLLEDHLWEVHRARMRNFVVRNPNFADWWSKTDKDQFTPQLRSQVDALLASGPRGELTRNHRRTTSEG